MERSIKKKRRTKMAFKMKFNIEYKVVNDNVVVCYATPVMVDDRIRKFQNLYTYVSYQYRNEYLKGSVIPKAFKGIAVRKPSDENDIEMAKEIARKKAMRLAYKTYKNYIRLMEKEIFKIVFDFNLINGEVEKKIKDIEDEIKDIGTK